MSISMSNPQRFFRHSRVLYNASLTTMIRLLSLNSEVVNFSGLKQSRSEVRMVSEIMDEQRLEKRNRRGQRKQRKSRKTTLIVLCSLCCLLLRFFPTAAWPSRNRREPQLSPPVSLGSQQVLPIRFAWRTPCR